MDIGQAFRATLNDGKLKRGNKKYKVDEQRYECRRCSSRFYLSDILFPVSVVDDAGRRDCVSGEV